MVDMVDIEPDMQEDSSSSVEEEKEDDANELKNQGNEFYRIGDYHQALIFYDRAIKKDSENAKLYGNRAAAYMMLGRYEDVIIDCKLAIELDPSFAKAYGRLAKAYFQVGDFQRSLEKYREASTLEINPDLKKELDIVEVALTCFQKAKSCLENKDYSKALSFARMVLNEATDARPFKVLFCEALTYNGKPDEAAQILAAVMRDHFNDPDVLCTRAKALFFSGPQQIAQASNHLMRALQHDPDHEASCKLFKQIRLFESMKTEGNALFSSKKWLEAIDAYGRALEVEPENSRVNAIIYCNRAAAYKEEGLMKEAVQDCTAAINIDPSYVKAYQRRARCHQATEDHSKAVQDFEWVKENTNTREAAAELREAKILLKRSKRKDYYKLLGVARDADERQIKKAYREQALRLHPDKLAGYSDEDKAKAEQQFKDVGEAYAVLTDPQKKRKYDNGTYDDGSGVMDADDADISSFFGSQAFFNGGGGRRGHGQHFSFNM